jgi:hypothetical protein
LIFYAIQIVKFVREKCKPGEYKSLLRRLPAELNDAKRKRDEVIYKANRMLINLSLNETQVQCIKHELVHQDALSKRTPRICQYLQYYRGRCK